MSYDFDNRSKEIDYSRLEGLCFIGGYERRLPVSITRMIENAYDWAHLPYVHESSFKGIELVDEGAWGWRALVTLPSLKSQYLELLVDKPRNYWATTVLSGDGEGLEIHTQAKQVSAREIDVIINFYLPVTLDAHRINLDAKSQKSILEALSSQYSVLYDEDEILMNGRQQAIDRSNQNTHIDKPENLSIGSVEELKNQLPKAVQFGQHRYVINQWNGEWVIYAADCPHLLGPLEGSEIDKRGRVTCPWHGYQFDITTGKNCSNNIAGLKPAPTLSVVDNQLILS